MADPPAGGFGELREALHGERTRGGFARVVEALREGFGADAEEARRVLMPYAQAALEAWPDEARSLEVDSSGFGGESVREWLEVSRGLRVVTPKRGSHDRARDAAWAAEAVAWIASAPELSGLRRLDLSRQRLTPAGAKVLAKAQNLGSLQDLDVSATRAQSLGLQALTRAPFARGLERLVARSSRVNVAGFQSVAESTRALVDLDLSYNPARGGLRLLARSEHLDALVRLDVSSTQANDEDLYALGASTGLGALRCLDLSGNRLFGPTASDAFACAPWLSRLEELRFQRSGHGARDRSAWFEAAADMKGLRALALEGVGASTASIEAFAGAPLDALRRLELGLSDVTVEQSRALCGAAWISNLERLSFTGVPLDEVSTHALAERVRSSRLGRLTLWDAEVDDAQGVALLRACAQAGVREVALGSARLGDAFARGVAALDLKGLRVLNLRASAFGVEAIRELAGATSLSGLEELRLSADLSDEARRVIAASKTLSPVVRRRHGR